METIKVCGFGELKAGDRFIWQGIEWEKISGNMAETDITGKNSIQEFHPNTQVVCSKEW